MPAAVGRNMREKLIVRLEVYSDLKEKVNDVNKDSNLVNKDNNLPTELQGRKWSLELPKISSVDSGIWVLGAPENQAISNFYLLSQQKQNPLIQQYYTIDCIIYLYYICSYIFFFLLTSSTLKKLIPYGE